MPPPPLTSGLHVCHQGSIVHNKRALTEIFRALVVAAVAVSNQNCSQSFSANFNRGEIENAVCGIICDFNRRLGRSVCVCVFFNATVSCVTLFCVYPLLSTGLITNPRLWCYYFSCFLGLGSQIKPKGMILFGDFSSL